jgi:pimeloyl-ACP methyl ester carboxylesterase
LTGTRSGSSVRWAKLLGKGAASLLALLLVAGLAYQRLATWQDSRHFPMPGIAVSVQGRTMHLDCRGKGSPTVLLDAGLGDSSATWALVQPEVATFTRVCAYDRPGLGWSEEASRPRDSHEVAVEVQELLTNAHIGGPYILVGHSFGGYNQLVFRSLHPEEVVGMVLVDSSHPDQLNRFPAAFSPEAYAAKMRYRVLAAPFGLGRVLGWCRDDYTFPNVPASWQKIAPITIALDCRSATFRASNAEELAFRQSGREAAATASLGNVPLIVLSHDPKVGAGFPPPYAGQAELDWSKMQEELRALSSNSKRVIATGSMHYVESYRPELGRVHTSEALR